MPTGSTQQLSLDSGRRSFKPVGDVRPEYHDDPIFQAQSGGGGVSSTTPPVPPLPELLCPKCGKSGTVITCENIFYNGTYVKYVPQFRESCASCGKFKHFIRQTPELIEKFNLALKEVKIYV